MVKMFPIQACRQITTGPHPLSIPWDVAELAYSKYAALYGRSQSLERLAERGGFGASEMDELCPDWRDRCGIIAAFRESLDLLVRAELPEASPDPIDPGGFVQITVSHMDHEAYREAIRKAKSALEAAGR